jgi:tryptophan 2,3-dioxygenase
MLNGELKSGPPQTGGEPLSYGTYLRVPELLSLQTPLGEPPVHDEMLFIIVQQAQELWFKQVLYELHSIVQRLQERNILDAIRLITRVNRIVRAVASEVDILAMMPPREFHGFRSVLTPSSGFESHQFRELEFASGLNDPTFLKLMDKYIGLDDLTRRWPVTLRDAAYSLLTEVANDPTDAWTLIYNDREGYPQLFALAEALSEYEVYFSEWRFHHIKLVERTIGDHAQGTAGSSGAGYLGKTLQYRFFPELWEARNRVTQMNS